MALKADIALHILIRRQGRSAGNASGRSRVIVRAAHGAGIVSVSAVRAECGFYGEFLAAIRAENFSSGGSLIRSTSVKLTALIIELILILRRSLHHRVAHSAARESAGHHRNTEYSHLRGAVYGIPGYLKGLFLLPGISRDSLCRAVGHCFGDLSSFLRGSVKIYRGYVKAFKVEAVFFPELGHRLLDEAGKIVEVHGDAVDPDVVHVHKRDN